ncbi:hypothetical protein CBR_g36607 [Chara braunii]|uniref:Uncharacterized protein n=1 Tax=Chara braunii TaxID=69332 RepID=A0A388JZ93_CHABU|nr:hypothetical protein CBR_g36607 [Chara braunii]|eukprot:GBG63120.1 hypothetical protein CBR_g36607 [Chara braunii]
MPTPARIMGSITRNERVRRKGNTETICPNVIDSRSHHLRHVARRGGCHAPASMCPNANPNSCSRRLTRGQAEHHYTLKGWSSSSMRAKRTRWRTRAGAECKDGVSKLRQLEYMSGRKDGNEATTRGNPNAHARRHVTRQGSSEGDGGRRGHDVARECARQAGDGNGVHQTRGSCSTTSNARLKLSSDPTERPTCVPIGTHVRCLVNSRILVTFGSWQTSHFPVMQVLTVVFLAPHRMSSSRGEGEPTGTSGRESGKDSTRRSSTAIKSWSNHSKSKWFSDWCCGDASNPTAQPCGPGIFVDDNKRRRVLAGVLRWEDVKGGRRHLYVQNVYGAKGNVVVNLKGALLDPELCEGFGAGAVNTPFYRELVLGGGFVLAREFFDMLEDKNIVLDVPCDVDPSHELSLPLRLCGGCESSGAAAEGGDLGSGPATQLHRGESRGQFNNNEDEGPTPPLRDTHRSVLSILGVLTDAPVREESAGAAGKVAASTEVNLETSEGQGAKEGTAGGLGTQGTP